MGPQKHTAQMYNVLPCLTHVRICHSGRVSHYWTANIIFQLYFMLYKVYGKATFVSTCNLATECFCMCRDTPPPLHLIILARLQSLPPHYSIRTKYENNSYPQWSFLREDNAIYKCSFPYFETKNIWKSRGTCTEWQPWEKPGFRSILM